MCSEATQVLQPGHFLSWCGWCCTGCLSYSVSSYNNTALDVVIMKQAWFDIWGKTAFESTLRTANIYNETAAECIDSTTCHGYRAQLSVLDTYCVVITTPYLPPQPPPPPPLAPYVAVAASSSSSSSSAAAAPASTPTSDSATSSGTSSSSTTEYESLPTPTLPAWWTNSGGTRRNALSASSGGLSDLQNLLQSSPPPASALSTSPPPTSTFRSSQFAPPSPPGSLPSPPLPPQTVANGSSSAVTLRFMVRADCVAAWSGAASSARAPLVLLLSMALGAVFLVLL
ncbi:MAG: hypothetical protein WDW38_010220 [Sanguina aurantia]